MRALIVEPSRVVASTLAALFARYGVAALANGESYDDVFHRADAAVYRAKANGRNRVESAA